MNRDDMMDILNIMSFIIGVMNYDENLTQTDKQDFMDALSEQTKIVLEDIHQELEKQNRMLEVLIDDKNKNTL